MNSEKVEWTYHPVIKRDTAKEMDKQGQVRMRYGHGYIRRLGRLSTGGMATKLPEN